MNIAPLTISDLRAWDFKGNAHSDHDIFHSIYAFVGDESRPLAERAEALYIMGDKGMGLTWAEMNGMTCLPGVSATEDARIVQEYLKEIAGTAD